MTIAEFFGAVLLYLLTVAPVKAFGFREFKNSTPGDPAFYQTPLRSRAYGAHMNGIETFPFCAVAVLLAEFRGSPQHLIDTLAIAFLALRFCLVLAYLFNRPTARTLLWNTAFFVNAGLFFLPAFSHS
jgi:uncharacterized MAPEG superfamily protein